jgi:hypothetical protein
MHSSSHVLMIRPVHFGFNAETAVNNAFQVAGSGAQTQERAVKEFDDMVKNLRENGVDVMVVPDTENPHTPDSIFPNNWISFHPDGTICLFPMFALNRRQERKPVVMEALSDRFTIKRKLDFSHFENHNRFLEGTGSMVLDRENKIAYACLSPRTDEKVLNEFCQIMGYSAFIFDSVDSRGQPIYHTNVMMCIADRFAVVCLNSIPQKKHREAIVQSLQRSGKDLIDITMEQLNHFAGNMLQLENQLGQKLLVMSTQALLSLRDEQKRKLESFNPIIHSSLDNIETHGGGSARCMIAEIYLKEKA